MKRRTFLAALAALPAAAHAGSKKKKGPGDVFGKIEFVTSFPDVKVQVVENFPDLKVKIVNAFPDRPGLWQIVNAFPDYKVQIVTSFPDFKIEFVENFPGVR